MNQKIPFIRKAYIKDLLPIQKLGTELMKSDLRFDPGSVVDWYHTNEGEKYLLKRIRGRKGICLLAEQDNEIVGYLTGAISSVQTFRPYKRAEIDNLYIKEPYRGTGIGTMLINAFAKWSNEKEVERIFLHVKAHNMEAIEFYKKYGLVERSLEMEKLIK